MDNKFEELAIETSTPQRSGLATAALICSLIVCCPITTLVGPILGIISLLTLKGRSGKGFAWISIIVGVIASAIWLTGGLFASKMALQFIEQAGEVTTTTIQAGYDGDYTTFRKGLTRNSSTVTDEEISSFIDELRSRYGNFDSASMNFEEQDQKIKPSTNEAPIPVSLIFETTDVSADVLMVIIPSSGMEYDLKVNCFRINDSKNGDIIFPKDSSCDSSIQESIEPSEDPVGS
jgi:hypothetical protein